MIDINYNRQDKQYEWIEPESGELFTFPAKQKHMAFRFAVSMLDSDLYEAAERLIEERPQLERVTWRAVELVCANAIGVFPAPVAGVVAMVESSDGYGVRGQSTNSFGVIGSSVISHGVYGYTGSTAASGVVGLQTGYSTSDWILWSPGGLFGGRNGVVGVTKANSGYGVAGLDSSTGGGWAGFFQSDNGSGVYISAPTGHTGLNVAGGTKNAVVATDEGSKLLYSEESTEVWFTDYGFGQLEDGLAVITIDEVFAQTVNLNEPYHVFVQVYGDAEVYVSNRTATSFEVHLRDGDSAVEFSYRIVAQRLGYEGDRLEPAPWADSDPNLYPEMQDASSIQGGSR